MKTIYPQVNSTIRPNGTIELFTFLRKQGKDKKWYLLPFREEIPNSDPKTIAEHSIKFHGQIYRASVKSPITPEVVGKEPVWAELDENQDSEKFRLSE